MLLNLKPVPMSNHLDEDCVYANKNYEMYKKTDKDKAKPLPES